MAMFEFGFNKVSVVRSDLAFERLSKGQDLIDLGPVSTIFGPLSLQLLKAVLNALQSVVRLRAHQTQSLPVPRRDGTVHIEDLAKPRTLVTARGAHVA